MEMPSQKLSVHLHRIRMRFGSILFPWEDHTVRSLECIHFENCTHSVLSVQDPDVDVYRETASSYQHPPFCYYRHKQRENDWHRLVSTSTLSDKENFTNETVVCSLGCDPLQVTRDVRLMGVKIFPEYRKTHIFTHTCYAIFGYLLNPVSEGGLGLPRCAWRTPPENVRSQRAAVKLGMQREGTMR